VKGAGAQALVLVLLAAAAGWVALALFPHDSNGALAVHDGAWYGMGAESDPLGWIMPHHPLFHALAAALVPPVRALGAPHPGHLAVRILSGLGAIWLLLQIVRLAGPGRALVGGTFALLVFCTRGFLVEAASGETVLPAAAAALFALRVAARPDPSPWGVGGALVFAVLLRLDNVLLLPGILVALASGLPKGARLSALAAVAAGAGLVTLLAYVAAWLIGNGASVPFDRWLLPSGFTPWMGAPGLTPHRLALYATSIQIATAGQTAPFGAVQPGRGLAVAAVILAAGLLLRGTSPDRRILAPVLVTLAARALFHTWFEADNFEWLVFPVAALAGVSAGMARGSPATGPVARCAGLLLVGGLVAWMLGTHLRTTWSLRGRSFMSAVEEAVGPDRDRLRFLAQGETPSTALALLGVVRYEKILEVSLHPESTVDLVRAEIAARPVDTVVVLTDRLIVNGQPYFAHQRGALRLPYDEFQDTPFVRFIRREGLTCAVRIRPDPSASRSATR
jgi:hypothetical protein